MIRTLTEILRFPLTVFVYTMEAIVTVMRDIQKTTDQTLSTMAGGVEQALGSSQHSENISAASPPVEDGSMSDDPSKTTRQEESQMSDQDLSGEDLKYVSYSILFTKADLETTLERQEEDLVNYSTNGASYGGLKIAHFFARAARNEVPRPQVWIDNGYPENADPNNVRIWRLPQDDEKYVTFIYQVDRRLSKNDPNYPKQQVKILTQIRDRL